MQVVLLLVTQSIVLIAALQLIYFVFQLGYLHSLLLVLSLKPHSLFLFCLQLTSEYFSTLLKHCQLTLKPLVVTLSRLSCLFPDRLNLPFTLHNFSPTLYPLEF